MTLIWCRCQIKHMASPPAVGWGAWRSQLSAGELTSQHFYCCCTLSSLTHEERRWHPGAANSLELHMLHHSSPARDNCLCPVLQSNLFVIQLLSFTSTHSVGNTKAFSEVETPLNSPKDLYIRLRRFNSRSTLVCHIHIKIILDFPETRCMMLEGPEQYGWIFKREYKSSIRSFHPR